MWSYNYTNPNELDHDGIKGQKWGVRRYQYADGTTNGTGKIRLSALNTKNHIKIKLIGL